MPERHLELLIVVPEDLVRACQSLDTLASINFGVQVLSCPWGSRGNSRNAGFKAARGEWVYFYDHDVSVIPETSHESARCLLGLSSLGKDIWALAGPYSSGPGCSYWGKCYNFLSNVWLEHAESTARFLAGNVIFRREYFCSPLYDASLDQGGEEIALGNKILQTGGRALLAKELTAYHSANQSLSKMLLRFFDHAREKRCSSGDSKQTKYTFNLARIFLIRPWLWPALICWVLANTAGVLAPQKRHKCRV
jgi:glycosyltransferase involved in cell wall biosynthesis